MSVPSHAGQGPDWSFPAGTTAFELRVGLDGRGTVTATVTLRRDGRTVHAQSITREVDGPQELSFPSLPLAEPGRYTLVLEVSAAGIRQRSTVTVRRG